MSDSKPILEHSTVVAKDNYDREGVSVKNGEHGTVVSVHNNGEAFTVEFSDARVVTLKGDEVVASDSDEALMLEHPLRPGVKFGVYDTQDNCWMGDDKGPKLFEDMVINGKSMPGSLAARVSADLCDIQMGWHPGRCKAMPFQEGPLTHKDDVTPKMSTEEALAGKESGRYL